MAVLCQVYTSLPHLVHVLLLVLCLVCWQSVPSSSLNYVYTVFQFVSELSFDAEIVGEQML